MANTTTRSVATITRPANTTAYSAGDVIGGVLSFASFAVADGHLIITSADIRYDVAAVPSGMTSLRLHLYSTTPPSAIADNAAFDLPSGDRSVYIGYLDFSSLTDLGSTLFTQVDGLNKQVMMASATLYGYLVTTAGWTPAGNSEVLQLTLRAVVP